MTEREFQIGFERQIIQVLPQLEVSGKLSSDTIFFYLNKAKDYYIRDLYRQFQQNQELSDKLRTLVKTQSYTSDEFIVKGNEWYVEYPEDYMFALGERVKIEITNNQCDNLIVKSTDVLEATIESVDRILENSLSEHHLKYNQAKPVRVYSNNVIVLITDGNYGIEQYDLTYLSKSSDIGKNMRGEYTDLPDSTHKEIIDVAVQMYIQQKALATQGNQNESAQ